MDYQVEKEVEIPLSDFSKDFMLEPLTQATAIIVDENNDPIRQFVNEIFPELQWDLIPFSFLYDLYGAWYKKNVGKGETVSRKTFVKHVVNVLEIQSDFICEDTGKVYKPSTKMDKAEPLIAEYNLQEWMNPHAMGSHDIEKRCHPVLKATYKGLIRK